VKGALRRKKVIYGREKVIYGREKVIYMDEKSTKTGEIKRVE